MTMKAKGTAVTAFVKFIVARERHRTAKEAGRMVDRPDPIISQYRFCNVRRNDDRVTKWIHEMFFQKWRDDPHLWFALVVARLFNNEEALTAIFPYILPFSPIKMMRALHARANAGQKNFNAAYIVSTAGVAMDKVDYVIDRILIPAWERRKGVSASIQQRGELEFVHQTLMELNGLASFMAAQVVADLKYAHPARWSDFHSFAASGPGSKRGLNRVWGRDKDAPMTELAFRQGLMLLRDAVNMRLAWTETITAQDIQNCLCEMDKYERARTGEGRPKQHYHPALKET